MKDTTGLGQPVKSGSKSIGFSLVLSFFMWMCMGIIAQQTWADEPAGKGERDFSRGLSLLKQQHYQEAREAYEWGLEENPFNASAHFYLGEACRGMKDWSCAEAHYKTSIKLDVQPSRIELAKERLRQARAWRTLRDLDSRLNDPNGSVEQIRQIQREMDLAKKSGLNDEQYAVYYQLNHRVDQKIAAQEAQAALAHKIQAMAALRRLEGKWKFVDKPAVYLATVNSNAELEMQIIQLTPDLEAEGLRNGDTFFWGGVLSADPDLRGYHKSRRDIFREGATLYATGTRLVSYFIEKAHGCARQQGYMPIKAVLAYVPSKDTIRILPLGRVTRSSGCSIHEENVNDEHDFYSADWQEEMKRP